MTDKKERDYRSRAERMKAEPQDTDSEQLETKSQDQIDYERHQEYLEEEKSRLTSEPRVYQEKQGPKRKCLYILAAVLILVMAFMIFRAVFIPRDQITEDTSEKISLALKENSESESSEENSEEESSEESPEDVETIESSPSSAESVTVTDLESEAEEEAVTETEAATETEVITGDWDLVPTEQTGEHVTDYSSGSQDRIEIKQAAAIATGIDPDNMSEHWVGNDGSNQGVYATVSDGYQGEQYRVHIQWVDGQGWQATEIEAAQ